VIFWQVASLFFALLCPGPWLLRCGSLFSFRVLFGRGVVGFERSVFLFLWFDWHTYLGFLFSAFFFSFVVSIGRSNSVRGLCRFNFAGGILKTSLLGNSYGIGLYVWLDGRSNDWFDRSFDHWIDVGLMAGLTIGLTNGLTV
jgi:hypothetical protein